MPKIIVHPKPNAELIRVFNLIRGDQRRAHRCESMPTLPKEKAAVQAAG